MSEEKNRIKFFSANIPLAIFSAVLALLLWIGLSLTAFPDMTQTFYDVPIDLSVEGSHVAMAGLSVIKTDAEKVNLSFTGRRDAISNYTKDDVRIRLNLENVRSSGSYTVPLIVESVRGHKLDNISVVPQTVHIDFDNLSTKTFSVEEGTLVANIDNLVPAMGYVIDPKSVTINPSTVTISGPQDYIDQVSSCVLSFEAKPNLRDSVELTPKEVKLYNGANVFESEMVTLSTEAFKVNVPVYITKVLPVSFVLSPYSNEIDVTTIPYTMSASSIKVMSQNSSIDDIKDINLGYIDIRDVEPGYVRTFAIPRNSYYTNISGVDEIEVEFDLEGYSTKSITLKNYQIHTINCPAGYEVSIEQSKLRVTAVGPAEILDSLDSSNFVAEIDLMDYEPRIGTIMLTASVYCPNHPEIWVKGQYNQVLASYSAVQN